MSSPLGDLLAGSSDLDLGQLETSLTEVPVIDYVNAILENAIRQGASDVHIEPYEQE
ncbi:MAG: hypothetical protein ACWGQW_21150, partial [bacterium]